MTSTRLAKIEHDLKGAIRTQQLIMEEAMDIVKKGKLINAFLLQSMENSLKKCADSWHDLLAFVNVKNHYAFSFYKGDAVCAYIPEIADFRIMHFRCFPYLYEGNIEYESAYLEGFSRNVQSLLILVRDQEDIIGISTAAPLTGDLDILKEIEEKFERAGYRPGDFFYYGEIIIKEEYKRKGICREIFKQQELYAREQGFKHLCLATVVRSDADPLRPTFYQNTDTVWKRMGFRKTNIFFDYEWPTIQADGRIVNAMNKMVFWIKE